MCIPGRSLESLQPLRHSKLTERTRLAEVAEKVEKERSHVSCSWQPSSDTGLPTRLCPHEDRTETIYPGPSMGPAAG